MPDGTKVAAARRCVLAVSVLDDVDVIPGDAGILLPGGREVFVTWAEVADTLGPNDADSPAGRARVAVALRLRRTIADLGPSAPDRLRQAARLLALPPAHALHPGPGWVRGRVRGGCLDLGVGLLGLTRGPDAVCPLPPGLAAVAGIDPAGWWPDLTQHADRMGAMAVHRLTGGRRCLLHPVGGCDVPSLLASPTLRRAMAGQDGTGMRAVAVPSRETGWFDQARMDPAFVTAVWQLTAEPERGLPRPVLVTADEVTTPCCGPGPSR